MIKKYTKWLLLAIVLLALFFALKPPVITPKDHFHVDKEQRLQIIENLKQDCSADNPIYLIATYGDVLNDENASKCWGEYMNECQDRKVKNKNLKIPTNCPVY